jgi:lipopolysaccharide export LptBFGC system permease protein LptF
VLLDRYILLRFTASFAILFLLLFLFAITIDIVLNLSEFVEDAEKRLVFQFYAYLHGLLAVGAMSFTLAQMYRHRELTAMLGAGVSLQRIAMPFLVGTFMLSAVQLLNQEFILPRIAPLLLRDHDHIGQRSVREFEVSFITDSHGNLYQAPSFETHTGTLRRPTILERDARGRTTRRIIADAATWRGDAGPDGRGAWILTNGRGLRPPGNDAASTIAEPIAEYPGDLTPEVITARRYGQFMAMLSLTQIRDLLAIPGFADARMVRALLRQRYARFALVVVNVLVMWLALPSFLLREPANLLRKSISCAALSIPAAIGAGLLMMADPGGIAPALGVFLPIIILGPIALARWTYVRS